MWKQQNHWFPFNQRAQLCFQPAQPERRKVQRTLATSLPSAHGNFQACAGRVSKSWTWHSCHLTSSRTLFFFLNLAAFVEMKKGAYRKACDSFPEQVRSLVRELCALRGSTFLDILVNWNCIYLSKFLICLNCCGIV